SSDSFTGNLDARLGEINKELSGNSQSLVDLERLINIWVVDETLPSNGGTRLLEVGTHDDDKVILKLVAELDQACSVFEGCGWVVNRARADNHKELVGSTGDDFDGFLTTFEDSSLSRWGLYSLSLVGEGDDGGSGGPHAWALPVEVLRVE